jgi:hypothetical protein
VEFYVQVLDDELARVWVDFVNEDGDVTESQIVGAAFGIARAHTIVKKMNDRLRLDIVSPIG